MKHFLCLIVLMFANNSFSSNFVIKDAYLGGGSNDIQPCLIEQSLAQVFTELKQIDDGNSIIEEDENPENKFNFASVKYLAQKQDQSYVTVKITIASVDPDAGWFYVGSGNNIMPYTTKSSTVATAEIIEEIGAAILFDVKNCE